MEKRKEIMKYLKLFENFQSEDEIRKICKKYKIKNYTINNGLVDVDGDVDLSEKNLTKLPLKFGKVIGDFNCYDNELTSLEGAPQSVGGYFSCSHNQLTNLEGAPNSVGGGFTCNFNQLTSLKGLSDQHRFKELYIRNNPFSEIYYLLGKWDSVANYEYFYWDSVAMYEYLYWDFLFEKDGVWCCDLDNLNSFLMVMTDVYKIPYKEVTTLKNYKCV